MYYSLEIRRPLGDPTPAQLTDRPGLVLRVGLPVLAGLLSAGGIALGFGGYRRLGPALFIAGAGLSAVLLGVKALEAEQTAGRL